MCIHTHINFINIYLITYHSERCNHQFPENKNNLCQWNRPVLHVDDSGRQNVWPSSSEYFLQCYFTFLSFIFYLCKYIHVCLHKHVCTHIHMHIHIYIHIYTCTYIKNIHKIWTYSLRRLDLTMSQKAILCNLNLLFLPSFATPFSSLLSCISLVFLPPLLIPIFITHLFN